MKKEIKFIAVMLLIMVGGSLTMMYSQTKTTGVPDSILAAEDMPPPPPPPDGAGRQFGRPDILQNLNLTDFQKEQIQALRFNTSEASSDYFTTIRRADEQLKMMVESGSFDANKAKPLVQAKADAMAALELTRLSVDASIQKLLTTDQKAQLAQLKERRPSNPPGGGFGPPPER